MSQRSRKEILIGLFISLLIVILITPFASSSPDGFERVAHDLNFSDRAEGQEMISSPLPDYEIPGLKNKTLAGIVAGITGTLLTFGLMLLLSKLIIAPKKKSQIRC